MQKRIIPHLLLAGIFLLLFIPAVHADEASEWYVKGQNAAITGDYGTALQYYNNAIAADPNYVAAYSGKAVALNKLGRFEEAVQAADIVLAAKNDPAAAEARAFALYSLGRYDDSVAAYDLFFTLRQNIPEAYCNQGRAYRQLGETTKAIVSLQKCVKLDPMNLDGWNQQGLIYLSLGEYGNALDAFNHCTRITLSNATIWNDKGLAYAGLEDYPNAMNCFKTAINLDPTFEEARKNLDKAYERKPFFTATTTPVSATTTVISPMTTQETAVSVSTTASPAPSLTQEIPVRQVQESPAATTTYAVLPLPVIIIAILAGAGICLSRNRMG